MNPSVPRCKCKRPSAASALVLTLRCLQAHRGPAGFRHNQRPLRILVSSSRCSDEHCQRARRGCVSRAHAWIFILTGTVTNTTGDAAPNPQAVAPLNPCMCRAIASIKSASARSLNDRFASGSSPYNPRCPLWVYRPGTSADEPGVIKVRSRCCELGERPISYELEPCQECLSRTQQPTKRQLELLRINMPHFCSINITPVPSNMRRKFSQHPLAPSSALPFKTGALMSMFFDDTRVLDVHF
jgi:hypothetical protein